MILDPAVSKHQHMIFIIISYQVDQYQHFASKYKIFKVIITIQIYRNHDSSKGAGITSARVACGLHIII